MFGQILQGLFDIVINIQQDKEKKTDWEQTGIIFSRTDIQYISTQI